MRIAITGSLAYDYIMGFPGFFKDHILPDKVHMLTVSFLVDSMKRMRGGVAGNIAYTLALLGEKPLVVSAAGTDFGDYRRLMNELGVDESGIKEVPNEFTASCFINTDRANNQIVAFYPGASAHAHDLTLEGKGLSKNDWVIISPTDPDSMARNTQEAKKLGCKYIFDPGKQTPRLSREQIVAGLDGAAVLVGNDYEFAMMAKAIGWTEEKLIASAPLTVVTRGAEGSTFFEREGSRRTDIPTAAPKEVLDPTGAGDAYLAGLAFGLKHALPVGVTGRVAALAATYAIEMRGCQEHRFNPVDFAARYTSTFGAAPELARLTRG